MRIVTTYRESIFLKKIGFKKKTLLVYDNAIRRLHLRVACHWNVSQTSAYTYNELITEYNHLKRQTNKYKLDPEKKKELLKLIDKLKI